MNETLKQFSADLQKRFEEALAKQKIGEFIAKTKADDNAVSFKVIISTSDEDRQGDTLDQSKWKLDNYKNNPVVLWAHDYYNPPIAICTGITLEGGKLVAEGKFAPASLNPFAAQIAGLYQAGYINTTSVGFIQHEDGDLELLEFSFVPVPANPYALSMRDVKTLKLDFAMLMTKGLTFVAKSPQAGDACETEDGEPGVLTESDGQMVCVPNEAKETKNNKKEMNDDLTKAISQEHTRHGEAVGKAIDDFTEKCMKSEKMQGDEYDKAIDEFTKAIDGEQGDHLDKCMKAIDENYALQDQKPKKAIDEFKSDMKAEHLKHVKCFDKAIEEFKGEFPQDGSNDDKKKAIDEFTKSAGAELERHKEAHMELCKAEADRMGEGETDEQKAARLAKKGAVADEMVEDEKIQAKYKKLDNAYSVFYAFTSAYMDDTVAVDDFEKLLDEAVELMKNIEGKAKSAVLAKALYNKSGRTISGKTKEKLEAVCKAIADHHVSQTADHEKSTNEIIASLKDLMGPQDDEGKEPKPDEKGAAPKPRSSTSGADADLEVYLLTQRLARQVKTAAEGVLRQVNQKIKENHSSGR